MRTGSIAGTIIAACGVLLAACATSNETASRSASSFAGSAAPPTREAVQTPTTQPSTPTSSGDLDMYGLPQADELFLGASISSLASGPAGVVVLGNDRATGALISWTSATGDDWVRHWLPGETFGGGTAGQLVSGSYGYLALGWRLEGTEFRRALWSSPDGVAWAMARHEGLPDGVITGLAAGPGTTVALVDVGDGRLMAAASRDGQGWQAAAFPAGSTVADEGLVALPAGFLAIGWTSGIDATGNETSTVTAWESSDGLTWRTDAQLTEHIAGRDSVVDWQVGPWGAVGHTNGEIVQLTQGGLERMAAAPDTSGRLVAGPGGMLWVRGGDRLATCGAVWQWSDAGWRSVGTGPNHQSCIETASPFVLGSAATRDGFVILAQLGESADRVAWLIRASGEPPTAPVTAGPVATAPAEAIPDPLAARVPRPAGCPAKPTTIEALQAMSPLEAVGCYGNATLAFRAWVIDPGEGYGGTCSAFTPAWIRECVLPDYQLVARRQVPDDAQPRLHAMRMPEAKGDIDGVGRWVRIEGHYDDPIASSCRGATTEGGDSFRFETEMPIAQAVLNCRQTFVVTDIRTDR